MAVDTPMLRRRRVVAFKIETTTGTAESLTAAEATSNIYSEGQPITPDIEFTARESQLTLSPIPGIPGARAANIEFETELVGKGSSGVPPTGDLWKAAGFGLTSQAYTVSTTSANAATLTIASYVDGRKYMASGVKLDCVISGSRGQQARCRWTGRGLWNAPADVAVLAPTLVTTVGPIVSAATFTIGGTAYRISDFELALNNEIILREDINDATGYHAAAIVNRRITFRCAPEATLLATKDWYAALLARTEAALSIALNGGTNNTITIAAPKLQAASVIPGERLGMATDVIEFVANRSASAGDDELVITYS